VTRSAAKPSPAGSTSRSWGHPPDGRLVHRHPPAERQSGDLVGGGAGKLTTARTFCAAITPLIRWRNTDHEKIGEDAALAQRLHQLATFLTGEETGSRFH